MHTAQLRVPGSTSNLGAGFDCIGLAVSRYLTAEYRPRGATLTVERHGTLAPLAALDLAQDVFVQAFRSVAGEDVTGTLVLDSEIPVGRGLGSSAAAVVGGLALGAAAVGKAIEPLHVLRAARRWEPHLDNCSPSLMGGLIAVAYDGAHEPHAFPLPLAPSVGFAYAASGVPLETARARAALPATVSHAEAVHALGCLAALIRGLATGDPSLLKLGFADRLHVPYRMPLIPGAVEAADAGMRAGAWGVTVSGAGSGLLAVAPLDRAEAVAQAMAGAFRISPGPEGVVGFALVPDSRGVTLDVPHAS